MQASSSAGLWTPNYIRVFLANLFLMITGNMFNSVFVLFLLHRGGTDLDGGIAAYLCAFCALIMRPVAGWLLDHRSRSLVPLLCLAVIALIPWWYLLAPGVIFLLAGRGLHGAMQAAASTALTTNAYDTISREHFNSGVSYFGFSNAIATAIGPGLGLFLWRELGAEALFAAASVMALISLLLMRKFRFRALAHQTEVLQREKGNLLDFLLEKRALPAASLQCFAAVLNGCVGTYIARFMEVQGNIASAGTYFAFQAAGTFCSRVFVGRISEKYGEGPLVWSSAILFTAGTLCIAHSPAAWLIYLGALLIGVSYGFTVTGLQIMSIRTVPPERRGAAASTYTCAWDISAAVGGLLAGISVTHLSYQTTFALLPLLFPVYLLVYVLKVSKHPSAFKVYQAQHRLDN